MSLVYLLDTNILSEPLRPFPNPSVMANIQKHQKEISTASIVWHELLFGSYRLSVSDRRNVIERYLYDIVRPSIPILEYDEHAAVWHAAERSRLEKIGRTPSFADGQIAAIAKVNNLVLVTANARDFEYFQDLPLENWKE